MGLLRSVENNPDIDYQEYRDQLYYGKYFYRVRFHLEGARYTWYAKTPEQLEKELNRKSPYRRGEAIKSAIENIEVLNKYVDWRNIHKTAKSVSIRIENNVVSIFANDLPTLKTIEAIDPSLDYTYTEAKVSVFSGTKYFINKPEYQYRIYLRSRRVEQSYIDNMISMLSNSKSLYPSKSLSKWLEEANMGQQVWKYNFSSSSHYIDYNDESMITYLSLMIGDMFGKKYKLEKRPEVV